MLLRLKIKPNSHHNQFTIEKDGSFKVKIKTPPVEGKANKELIRFLSEIFELPKSYIMIVKGETSSNKQVSIEMDEKVFHKKLSLLSAK